MRLKFAFFPLLPLLAAAPLAAVEVTSPPTAAPSPAAADVPKPGIPEKDEGPAKAAMEAFRTGKHDEAVKLAKPLADDGIADAIYLMGFAHESGQGAEPSRDKAIDYYRKAAAGGQKDAIYRLSFILLASEKPEDREEARIFLERAAKDDPAVAGRILGEAYLRGRLTEQPDYEKTVRWWNIAADAKDSPSLMLLARLYEGQFGFPEKVDAKKVVSTYTRAAEMGDSAAMTSLGSRLLSGPEAVRNEKLGREWLKKAVDAKEYTAFLALGDFEEKIRKDPKVALAAYERGKDAGQVDCTLRAGEFYLEGKGTEKDVGRGISLLEEAAKKGSAVAHLRLAAVRFSGDQPDVFGGYGNLLSAAAGGLVEAQNELALLYLSGKLGAADTPAAAAWLTQAAKAGFAPSQNNLATLFQRGAGVPQNFENAGQLYSLAANQGHGPATLALARIHVQGLGAERNLAKAWALATLAAERGEKEGETLAKELAAAFDAKQTAEAKKALEEIKRDKPATPKPPK